MDLKKIIKLEELSIEVKNWETVKGSTKESYNHFSFTSRWTEKQTIRGNRTKQSLVLINKQAMYPWRVSNHRDNIQFNHSLIFAFISCPSRSDVQFTTLNLFPSDTIDHLLFYLLFQKFLSISFPLIKCHRGIKSKNTE